MKQLLTIITRATVDRNQNSEYEEFWLPFRNFKDSVTQDIEITESGGFILLRIQDLHLLIVSGNGAIKHGNFDPDLIAIYFVEQLQNALAQFNLQGIHQHILIHQHIYSSDTDKLQEYLSSKNWAWLEYSLGSQNGAEIYKELYKPLYQSFLEYIYESVSIQPFIRSFGNTIEYIHNHSTRAQNLTHINFESLFPKIELSRYLFICNSDNFPNQTSSLTITSESQLEKLTETDLTAHTATYFIVLCELNWSYASLPQGTGKYNGIEIVKILRRKFNLIHPVLFVSDSPEEVVHHFDDSIIFAMGHHFVSLNGLTERHQKQEALATALAHPRLHRKLTDMELLDIQEHFCSVAGALKIFRHQLENFGNILKNIPDDQKDVNIFEKWDRQYIPILRQFNIAVPSAQSQELMNMLTLKTDLASCISDLVRLINAESANSTDPKNTVSAPRKWNLVVIDDEADDQRYQLLSDMMRENGCDVYFFHNGADAFDFLNNNEESKNTRVLISDFRLYEANTFPLKLQAQQGYEIIADLAARRDLAMELVIFSAMPRKFLLDTFNNFGVRAEVFSKVDYFKNETAVRDFTSRITRLGDIAEEKLLSMPKSSGWENILKNGYIAYRNSPERDPIEERISEQALYFIGLFNKGLTLDIPICSNVKPKFEQTLTDRAQEKFIKIFIARRVAIYLHVSKEEQDILKIAQFILKNKENADFNLGSARTFFASVICLAVTELPFGITFEEVKFLKDKCKLKLNPFLDFSRDFFRDFGNATTNALRAFS